MRGFVHGTVAAVVLLAACRRDAPSTEAAAPASVAPAASAAMSATSKAPAPIASAPIVVVAAVDACAPAPRIAPKELVATWTKRIGQRVRVTARVERTIDFTEAVVVAGGERFAVMLGPDQLWSGEAERPFTVMGWQAVKLGGSVTLPELVLESSGCAP